MNKSISEILIIILLILINGIFSLSEMAIISARKTRLREKVKQGDIGAQNALALSKEPTRFLSTIQIGITLIGILTGAFGGATLAEEIGAFLSRIEWLARYSEAIGVGIVVILITFFSLVIGELAPKRIALNNAENIAVKVAAPMIFFSRIMTPIVSLLSRTTEAVIRLAGIKTAKEPSVTEEEIKMMIYDGTNSGIFEVAEQEILERVFKLADRRVSTLMTHRTSVVFIDIEDNLSENLEKIVNSGHSRFPVCKNGPDNVLGIIQVKDLFAKKQVTSNAELQTLLKPAVFIHEAMNVLALLEKLRSEKNALALIVDEFGGITGIVTINDVLEAIVGDIPMLEDEIEEPDVILREDGSYLLDGMLGTHDLKELLVLSALPDEETAGYETLGGMMMSRMGQIPNAGASLVWMGWRFEVVDMDGFRVDKVLASQI